MVKFVKRERKLRAVVGRAIESQGLLIKVNEFYALFKNKCYKLKSYANIAKIAEFWRGPSPAEFADSPRLRKEADCAKIFRILGRLYLDKHHFPYVFNSLKIKPESKRLHMEGVRKILSLQ